MSSSIETGTADPVADTASSTEGLRSLYYTRFGFAVVWALLLMPRCSPTTIRNSPH